MAFLNFFADLTVNMPNAIPWEWLLTAGFTFIASVAIRIVFLTIILKLILSPLDFYQRYKMRKNQIITQRLKPQIEKLEAQYSGNDKVLQQKKMQLNRKSGMSMFSTCLPMIATVIVFIWLWQSLNNIAQYNQFLDYVNMYDVYEAVYVDAIGEGDLDEYAEEFRAEYTIAFDAEYALSGDIDAARAAAKTAAGAVTQTTTASFDALYKETYSEWFAEIFGDYIYYGRPVSEAIARGELSGSMNAKEISEAYCVTVAQHETFNYYYGMGDYAEGGTKADKAYEMQGFIWIKNVWTADVPWTAPIKASVTEFRAAVGPWATESERSGLDKAQLAEVVDMYDTVTKFIHSDERNAVNGWLILPILALLLNVATQLITRKQQKSSGQTQMTEGQSGCMMKAMMFVMPAMMFVFAIQYTAVFTLYMVTNSLMSLIINVITTFISKRMVKGDAAETNMNHGERVERYGRQDPNAKKEATPAPSSKDKKKNNKNKYKR